jgi:uncharacterized protein
MFVAKVHSARGKSVLAVCDKPLLGKVLTEGRKQLDLSGDFYRGEPMDAEGFCKRVEEFDLVNLVGPKIIGLAEKLGLVSESQVIRIAKIPHAQILNLHPSAKP